MKREYSLYFIVLRPSESSVITESEFDCAHLVYISSLLISLSLLIISVPSDTRVSLKYNMRLDYVRTLGKAFWVRLRYT